MDNQLHPLLFDVHKKCCYHITCRDTLFLYSDGMTRRNLRPPEAASSKYAELSASMCISHPILPHHCHTALLCLTSSYSPRLAVLRRLIIPAPALRSHRLPGHGRTKGPQPPRAPMTYSTSLTLAKQFFRSLLSLSKTSLGLNQDNPIRSSPHNVRNRHGPDRVPSSLASTRIAGSRWL